jgi:DHA2 family multidrug resistance protein
MLIFARVVQGAVGGALQPLSQAILMESFPPEKRGVAMATFGMGVVVAPIIGPVLGGWITDSYSWRWIFYINVPIGIVATLMCQAFVEDPPYLRTAHERRGGSIDYIGFGAMALWLATLQIILDRGQQDDWFGAAWIRWASAICFISMVVFIAWELRVRHPLVHLGVFRNRNFSSGTLLILIVGIVLYSTTALLPLFLQTLMGYSSLNSGMAVAPRGVGAVISLMIVGQLVGRIDMRLLIVVGFSLLAYSCWLFGRIDLQIARTDVMWPNILSGLGVAAIFVPLTTLAMASLPVEEMGNAAGIFNLARNIGGGIGISLTTTLVARGAQAHQAMLVGNVSPMRPVFWQYLHSIGGMLAPKVGAAGAQHGAVGTLYGEVQQQAALCAYVDTFMLLAVLCLCCVPVVLLFKKVKPSKGPAAVH